MHVPCLQDPALVGTQHGFLDAEGAREEASEFQDPTLLGAQHGALDVEGAREEPSECICLAS